MQNKRNKKEVGLFPNYFKKIGIAVMILAFVTISVVKLMNIEIVPSQKEFLKICTLNGFILGLFVFALAKDKVEDEMTVAIRLKSMAWTFSWAVLYVIITPFVSLIFKYPIQDLPGQKVVISMLFVYLITYYFQKIRR